MLLHHEESPEKPYYANPPFLDNPLPLLPYPFLFYQKISDPPPSISINFEKVEPPPSGDVRTIQIRVFFLTKLLPLDIQ